MKKLILGLGIALTFLTFIIFFIFIRFNSQSNVKSLKSRQIVSPEKDLLTFQTNAFLVGVSDYEHHKDLANPELDVKAIEKELREVYKCETKMLLNPTNPQFRRELRQLAERQYGPNDQLLVFFSGHGWFDKVTKRGYLAFKDSKPLKDDTLFDSYVPHEEVRTILERLDCNHVLLIVDSCFSGTLDPPIAMANEGKSTDLYSPVTRTEFIRRKLRYKTRRYITAGGKEYVPDGRPGHHSPFARRLLESLRSFGGGDGILTLEEMLLEIEKATPEPRTGELLGHEPGGSFVLIASSGSIKSKDEVEIVFVPAGEFQMGTSDAQIQEMLRDNPRWQASWFDDEKPIHTVYLNAFYMDKYEVTNAQYSKFLNEYRKNDDAAGNRLIDLDDKCCLIEKSSGVYHPKKGYENHPVVEVSWYGATAYAQFYGKRLPAEAEWEKAARGELVGKKFPWGDKPSHGYANYSGKSGQDKWDGTSPVGSFPANGYGLFDMAGNVWEWCADKYDSGYYSKSSKNNPTGPASSVSFVGNNFTSVKTHRVSRGGSYSGKPNNMRAADRYREHPAQVRVDLGFRCVISASSILRYVPAVEGEVVLGSNIDSKKTPPVKSLDELVTSRYDKDGMKMVSILAGTFKMGDETGDLNGTETWLKIPQDEVNVDAFLMDEQEVTNEQYCKFLNSIKVIDDGETWLDSPGNELIYHDWDYCQIEKNGGQFNPKSGYENHPVVSVYWSGANKYAKWVGGRLPTEAEWEKAARGCLIGRKYPNGDSISHDDANYEGTGGKDIWKRTAPVKSFKPNGYELYDMAGNVHEWCADYWDTEDSSSKKWYVIRGGSWADDSSRLRCSFRFSNFIFYSDYSDFVGFRVVIDIDGSN